MSPFFLVTSPLPTALLNASPQVSPLEPDSIRLNPATKKGMPSSGVFIKSL